MTFPWWYFAGLILFIIACAVGLYFAYKRAPSGLWDDPKLRDKR